jgi:cell division septum initiation protein DivIVA
MDQFRVEEEIARLVRENEAAEAEMETLRRRLETAQEKLVGIPSRRLRTTTDTKQEEKEAKIISLQGLVPGGDDNDRTGGLQQRVLHLEMMVKDQEDVIAEKEGAVTTLERSVNTLKRKVGTTAIHAEPTNSSTGGRAPTFSRQCYEVQGRVGRGTSQHR